MSADTSKLADFLSELKRRRVFRVAAVYAGVAFIIVQIVDGTFESMGIPIWGERFVFVLLAIGFPIAIGMAWAFDLTEKGLVKTKPKREAAEARSPHPIVGNKTLAVIAVLAIIVAVWALLRGPSPGGAHIRSIAVLPLDNLSGDPEQEYFTEGMHEAIISNLNHLGALKVISRTSAMRYQDTDKLLPVIARELGVDALVEGSVYKVGNQVRITALLIHGTSDEHLWDNEYEGDLTDILSLQKTVARAIAEEIGLALKPEEETYLTSISQVNPEAYDLYLKGWQLRSQETGEAMSRAVGYLEQAVALDSTFARAWAALAHCYFQLTGWRGLLTYNTAIRGKQVLDKALELDPNDVHALVVFGNFKQMAYFDLVGAEASYRQALELEPNNVNALYEYGLFLSRVGRPDEALLKMERARELDPLATLPLYGFGWIYYYNRDYSKAQEHYQALLELQPGFGMWWPRRNERALLMQQGRYMEAIAMAEEAGDLLTQLRAEWALGNREKVYEISDSLRSTGELLRNEQDDYYWSASFYAIMGEKEKALSLLEKASEDPLQNGWYIPGLVYNPEFDFLRAEPRFKALFPKLGLTEVFDENGNLLHPLDETLEAYNAPGSR